MQMVKLAFTVFLEENCTFILHCEQRKFELHYTENKIIMIKVSKKVCKASHIIKCFSFSCIFD